MRFTEIQEGLRDPKDNPCWKGYKPVGTKKKAGRTVPNCVPVKEQRVAEGYQDFNKVEPYEVCLAGKPVKQFDYYEDARRFHDNWKKKLYREGNKEKADKITLNPVMKETATAPIIVPKRKRKEKPEPKFHIPYTADDYVPPAVQIARDEAAKKNKEVKEDQGSWIVYDPKTKQIKKRFKTHTAGKSYAKVHGLGFASSEYYFDNIKQAVAENEEDDWSDEEDDRLRDGDYVRDRQDGEYGEIFRMSGDPTERRVRILDRDGRGWYISPDRLDPVDLTDPDIQRYFGRHRQRDLDEQQN